MRRWRLLNLESRIAPAALFQPGQAYSPHEIIAYVSGSDRLGGRAILTEPGGMMLRVPLDPGQDPITAVSLLAQRPDVVWASPNYIVSFAGGEFVPNDPLYPQQYHLAKAQAATAWDTTTGSASIIVAVADDGLAIGHPDIAANVWVNAKEVAGNGIDDDGNGYIDDIHGWDFVDNDATVTPENGDTHGTHVAGIIGAKLNNATGVAGLAGGGVRLMPLRFVGNGVGTGTSADTAEALIYAADNGAKIVNTSHTYDVFVGNNAVTTAVSYAYGKGVLLINSAGNNNQQDASRGAFTQILFTAATDANDQRTSFSNYGKYVDIAAPGMNVLSTTEDSGVYAYRVISGTSMASPNAAGVAALIWNANPGWTRDQVAAQLIGTADRIDEHNPGYEDKLGFGRANAARGVTGTVPPPRVLLESGLPAEGGFTTSRNFTISFDVPLRLDPATVSTADFELRGDGPDNTFGTGDDTLKTLTLNGSAAYRMGTDGFTITFSGNLAYDRYRFTIKSAGLLDPFGQALDGDSDGLAGGDFVRTFRVAVNSIQGTLYEDMNSNLLFGSATDPVLAGWTVYLDANKNGVFDGGETSVVTSAAGVYNFLDLPIGTHSVRAVVPAGWTNNRPSDGYYDATLGSSTTSLTGRHFGMQRANAVYGRTYEDLNGNGASESADPNLPGRPVYIDLNANGIHDFTANLRGSTDVPKSLTVGIANSVINVAGLVGPITDVDVGVTVTHPAIGDLTLTLVAPGGQRITLMRGIGGESDNLTAITFDDETAISVEAGAAPFTGRHRPINRLMDLDGLDPNGVWTLEVHDATGFTEAGSLTAWSLVISGGEPYSGSDANGLFVVTLAPVGASLLRSPPPVGWVAATPGSASQIVVVESTPAIDAHFGQWQQNAVYGRVYNDANGNAGLDGGESTLTGWRAYADRNGNGSYDVPVSVRSSTDVPKTISNLATVTSNLSVAGLPDPITDLNVTLSINHTHESDPTVTLIGPDGRRVLLFRQVGTSANNFTSTVLDDEAGTAIIDGVAPYTGTFRPFGLLSTFDGMSPNGLWRLEVVDTLPSNTGSIVSWSLEFETAEPSGLSASHGGFVISNLTGAVDIRRVLLPGWGGTQPAADSYPLILGPGDTVTGRDFGQRQTPPRIASFIVNDGAAQRSRVASVTVNFDRAVSFASLPESAFQLTRTGPGAPVGPVAFAISTAGSTASRSVVTLSFPPLADGKYQLTVLDTEVSENGEALDGDGNAVAGGNAGFEFHRLFGDANGDATVGADDFLAFRLAFLSANPVFDFDDDGSVGPADFLAFRLRFLVSI